MAFSTFTNLVRMTTPTIGTGTITLGTAVTGFIAVPAALDGKSVTYEIADVGSAPIAREVGRGVYTASGTTLTRATVFASTNAGLKISLSGNAYVSLSLADDDLNNMNMNSLTMGTAAAAGSGEVVLAAGTNTTHPLFFTSGTNLTSAQNGACEYDGNALYFTPSSTSRGSVPAMQYAALTGTYTLTSTTAVQKLFNVPSNGSLTVTGSTRYMFDSLIQLSSMSATSGNALFDIKGGGNASFTSANWFAVGLDATTLTTTAALSGLAQTGSASTSNIVTAGLGSGLFIYLKGTFRIGTGGTIIPSIGLTTAAAAVVTADSYFACWPMGAAATTTVGNWT